MAKPTRARGRGPRATPTSSSTPAPPGPLDVAWEKGARVRRFMERWLLKVKPLLDRARMPSATLPERLRAMAKTGGRMLELDVEAQIERAKYRQAPRDAPWRDWQQARAARLARKSALRRQVLVDHGPKVADELEALEPWFSNDLRTFLVLLARRTTHIPPEAADAWERARVQLEAAAARIDGRAPQFTRPNPDSVAGEVLATLEKHRGTWILAIQFGRGVPAAKNAVSDLRVRGCPIEMRPAPRGKGRGDGPAYRLR